jgi:hypothetical protein
VQRIKFKQLDHWQYQYLDAIFGIINWCQDELQKLDRNGDGQHQTKASVLYIACMFPENREEETLCSWKKLMY